MKPFGAASKALGESAVVAARGTVEIWADGLTLLGMRHRASWQGPVLAASFVLSFAFAFTTFLSTFRVAISRWPILRRLSSLALWGAVRHFCRTVPLAASQRQGHEEECYSVIEHQLLEDRV